MRFISLAFVAFVLFAGCSGGEPGPASRERPEEFRSCGELDGVDAVEPTILGEDGFGCPVFAPVPCTEPRAYYDDVCGDSCTAGWATNSDGDAWIPGCIRDSIPCMPFEPNSGGDLCQRNPVTGEELWYFFGDCGPLYEKLLCEWPFCDEDRSFEPLDSCK